MPKCTECKYEGKYSTLPVPYPIEKIMGMKLGIPSQVNVTLMGFEEEAGKHGFTGDDLSKKGMHCQAPGGGPTKDPIALIQAIVDQPCNFFAPKSKAKGSSDWVMCMDCEFQGGYKEVPLRDDLMPIWHNMLSYKSVMGLPGGTDVPFPGEENAKKLGFINKTSLLTMGMQCQASGNKTDEYILLGEAVNNRRCAHFSMNLKNICWFCETKPADIINSVLIMASAPTDTQSMCVPRCQECSSIHEETLKKLSIPKIAIIIVGIIAFVLSCALSLHLGLTIAIMVGVVVALIIEGSSETKRYIKKYGIKPPVLWVDYPKCVEYTEKHYELKPIV